MRKLFLFSSTILYAFFMTFCSYAPLVTSYIVNEENYVEVEVEVVDAIYHDDGYSYLFMNLTEFYRYYGFTGKDPGDLDPSLLGGTLIKVRIMPQNAKILKDRGFFDDMQMGDVITIKTTCWIHDGIEYHFLAAVKSEEIEYLTFEEGFHGIVEEATKLKEIELDELLKHSKK